jgi:hypothetical protein
MFGLFTNINGAQKKISETVCLQQGDFIGIRLNRDTGCLGFDINGVDQGILVRNE